MNTSETLILKLREFEGLRLEAYKDANIDFEVERV